eukprot:scaffold31602_cov19-Tisochrysis_lutea.AAC.4
MVTHKLTPPKGVGALSEQGQKTKLCTHCHGCADIVRYVSTSLSPASPNLAYWNLLPHRKGAQNALPSFDMRGSPESCKEQDISLGENEVVAALLTD